MMIDEIRCHTLTTINFSITRTDSAWAKLGCHWLPLTCTPTPPAHAAATSKQPTFNHNPSIGAWRPWPV